MKEIRENYRPYCYCSSSLDCRKKTMKNQEIVCNNIKSLNLSPHI